MFCVRVYVPTSGHGRAYGTDDRALGRGGRGGRGRHQGGKGGSCKRPFHLVIAAAAAADDDDDKNDPGDGTIT